jgi:predicted PolB exonuclease-like 3'-5' exonuclease
MARLRGGFHLLAQLIGLPGKGEIHGSDVQGLWEAGRRQDIACYCRRDVIQTYLLFLRVELMRGRIDAERYAKVLSKAERFRREVQPG